MSRNLGNAPELQADAAEPKRLIFSIEAVKELALNQESTTTQRAARRKAGLPPWRIPADAAERTRLRAACRAAVATLPAGEIPDRSTMESLARQLLRESDADESLIGWAMVGLNSCFWEGRIRGVPYHRRLLLLPSIPDLTLRQGGVSPVDSRSTGVATTGGVPCTLPEASPKRSVGKPLNAARSDEDGISQGTAPAEEKWQQNLIEITQLAEQLGYRLLDQGGWTEIYQAILSGTADAVMGVASLEDLELAYEQLQTGQIPAMAVPFARTAEDERGWDQEAILQMIRLPYQAAMERRSTYLELLRTASQLFEPAEFQRLCPRAHPENSNTAHPIAATESIALDFLCRGGKQSRPFMLLAVYAALTQNQCGGGTALSDSPQPNRVIGERGGLSLPEFPDFVKRTAISIEAFHKASLVHDDIQDDDAFRYGAPAIHREYGVPLGINIGDYLIGLGYRMVSRDRRELGAERAADLLDFLADAHQRLCEGQGAELVWRDLGDKRLTPADALEIYALKTSPAFEAALYCGARLAGPVEPFAAAFQVFARNLGIAFQILNDLKDWQLDRDNKKQLGADLLQGRPTVLWALAWEGLNSSQRQELQSLVGAATDLTPEQRLERARRLYTESRAFETAQRLVQRHRELAEQVAMAWEPGPLRSLLNYIIDTVLGPKDLN